MHNSNRTCAPQNERVQLKQNMCNSNRRRIQVKEKPTVTHVTQTEHMLLKQKTCN
jgi:hypothetical protein